MKVGEIVLTSAIAGTIGAVCFMGVNSLRRGLPALFLPQSQARVYRRNGECLVSVRYPGQWCNLQDFVQPDNPDVLAVYSQIGPDPWALYDFVCRNIDYRRDWGEFWQTPSETLRGYGDCEDSALLLTSLIRAGGIPNAYVALGEYQGWGHAWVVSGDGEVLEATFTEARHVPHPEHYCPYVCFNDQEVIELWPGALGEVFKLGRNEDIKLSLMAKASGNGANSDQGVKPIAVLGLVIAFGGLALIGKILYDIGVR